MSRLKFFINENGEKEDDKILVDIMDFFVDNPSPDDDKVHALAEKLGLEPDDFEEKIYFIIGSFLGAGRAKEKKFTEKDANPKELRNGIDVEMEHTKNKAIAKRIALDHLAEFPDYYTRLLKMEKEGEKAKKGE